MSGNSVPQDFGQATNKHNQTNPVKSSNLSPQLNHLKPYDHLKYSVFHLPIVSANRQLPKRSPKSIKKSNSLYHPQFFTTNSKRSNQTEPKVSLKFKEPLTSEEKKHFHTLSAQEKKQIAEKKYRK